jgi:hypothetical protein
MTDRVAALAAFLRENVRTEKGELLLALFERWPDIRSEELQSAIDSRRPTLVLAQQVQTDDAG